MTNLSVSLINSNDTIITIHFSSHLAILQLYSAGTYKPDSQLILTWCKLPKPWVAKVLSSPSWTLILTSLPTEAQALILWRVLHQYNLALKQLARKYFFTDRQVCFYLVVFIIYLEQSQCSRKEESSTGWRVYLKMQSHHHNHITIPRDISHDASLTEYTKCVCETLCPHWQ